MTNDPIESDFKLYLYWFSSADFSESCKNLRQKGKKIRAAHLAPCQAMNAFGDKCIYVPSAVWSRICGRQGSWYRASHRAGQILLASRRRLSEEFEPFVDAVISYSTFKPDSFPNRKQLLQVVETEEYQQEKPQGWENIGLKDAVWLKFFLTVTRFWGYRDNLAKFWLCHRANHANFLARRFTTEVDGEAVAYSVTPNAGICSSCAELFNLVAADFQKLVSFCPGAIFLTGKAREAYFLVRPIR